MPRTRVARGVELPRQPENSFIVAWPTDDLQANRKPARVEAARNGDRRQSEIIRKKRVGRRERLRVSPSVLDRRHGRGRRGQQHDVEIAERTSGDGFAIRFDRVEVAERGHREGCFRIDELVTERGDLRHGGVEGTNDFLIGGEGVRNRNPQPVLRSSGTLLRVGERLEQGGRVPRSSRRDSGVRVRFHGFFVGKNALCSVEEPIANSSMFVLPIKTAPSERSRSITVASKGGTKFSRIRDAHVVRTPLVA